jgi:hypothetical protein
VLARLHIPGSVIRAKESLRVIPERQCMTSNLTSTSVGPYIVLPSPGAVVMVRMRLESTNSWNSCRRALLSRNCDPSTFSSLVSGQHVVPSIVVRRRGSLGRGIFASMTSTCPRFLVYFSWYMFCVR